MSKTSVLVTVTVIMGKVSGLLPMSAESLSGECPHHCPPYYSPVCGTDNRSGCHVGAGSQSEVDFHFIDQSEVTHGSRHDTPPQGL